MEYEYDEEYEGKKQKEWGCWLMDAGKKVLMAGFVISSAPVLLPPLLVVSALGFAMSVPSGVVLASYACTRSLMTKLLPPPPPLEDEEDDDFDDDEEATAEAAERKMSEDVKNEIEMRIELVDDENHVELVDRERESGEEREMSSSSSSSSENENIDVKVEEEENQGIVLRNDIDHDNKTAISVNVEVEPKKDGDNLKEGHGVKNGALDSHEEAISEDKIWEKIDAIRVIVGFKAPKRSSYVEEVKALYLFTGIQPPTQDQSHLAHLTFLMSVIGLK